MLNSLDPILRSQVTINDVRSKELDYVVARRRKAGIAADRGDTAHSLVGLALSGGGIRSATTNLGILQALSRMGVLPVVDYLSTVSGGGYIGSSLAALLSVRDPAVPPPPDTQSTFAFADRDHLWFTPRWLKFPFNPDRVRWDARFGPLGRRVVSHLRTHGTFLVARRGLFRRDAMRSIGHLITGTAYHVAMIMLTLLTLTLLSLWVAHHLTDDMPGRLSIGAMDHTAQPSRTEVRDADGGGPLFVVQEMAAARPVDRLLLGFKRFREDVSENYQRPAVIAAAGIGGATTTAMLLLFGWVVRRSRWPTAAAAGLSLEETRERGLLKVATVALIVASVAAAVAAVRIRTGTGIAFLVVPVAVFAGAKAAGFLFYVLRSWNIGGEWDRRFRSLWGAYQTLTTYGLGLALVFAALPIVSYAAADGASPWVIVAPLVSLVLGRALVGGALGGGGRLALPKDVRNFLLGLFAIVVIGFLAVSFGGVVLNVTERFTKWREIGLAILVLTAAFLFFANINRIGPHYFYRDRLLETYLRTEYIGANQAMEPLADSMEMYLTELHGTPVAGSAAETVGNTSPYLLISAAINLAGSRDLTRKDRKSGYFLFSKYFCGSTHTGFEPTETYRGGSTRLGRAITISGAAAGTGMGQNTFFAQSFFMALFNLRLGYWMANPGRKGVWDGIAIWPFYLLREIFGLTHERTRLVNLSDGGHTGDNVGIYPLLQRRCQVIIACDAEQDPALAFGSFTEALRHAYIDLNVDVDIDLDMIRPDPRTGHSRSHCAVGRIRYKECPDRPNWLIYLKNSLTGDEPAPVMNYKQTCPDFPHETTADQFFDDAQFESYRALGVHIAEDAFAAWTSDPMVAQLLNTRAPA